jgi:pentatricopeptide repeat protein
MEVLAKGGLVDKCLMVFVGVRAMGCLLGERA